MPNKRLPEGERKEFVGIRLPKWMVEQLLQKGSLQDVIEGILRKHVKKDKNKPLQ